MKQLLTISFIAVTFIAAAQKQVVSAFNANKSGDYKSAAGYIEEAITIEKAAVKEKTWRYRGDIYLNIGINSALRDSALRDSALAVEFPNALVVALESFNKAKELDVKGHYEKEVNQMIDQIILTSEQKAFSAYQNEDFSSAGENFDVSGRAASILSKQDSTKLPIRWLDPAGEILQNAIYNAGICYQKAGLLDQAIKCYEDCANLKFNTPGVLIEIARILRDSDKTEEAIQFLQAARVEYPLEQVLIIEELNIYIDAKDFVKAQKSLELAINGDPENHELWFSLGSVTATQADSTEVDDEQTTLKNRVIECYIKAIELKADYFDANFNLGALYFNDAASLFNEANAMWKPRMSKTESAALEAAESAAKEYLQMALPYLEAAHDALPEDINTIRTLRDIYTRTGQDELREKMNQLLN